MAEYIERGGKNFPTPFGERPNMPLEKVSYRQWWNHCLRAIYQQPAADVRPVVRSAWEQVEVMRLEDMQAPPDTIASMYCPNCKRYTNRVYIYGDPTEFVNYCCYCGADMRGNLTCAEQEGET